MLTDKEITDYQAIYKKIYGKNISKQEALEQGIKLIRLMEIVYKPMTQEEYDMVQKRRAETKDS